VLSSHRYDRPLHRRGHRGEVRQARVDLRDLPDRIDGLTAQQAVLARSLVEERNTQRHLGEQAAVPARNADRLRQALDSDAAVRGREAADGPDLLLVARLGPPPADGDERERWILAAGRITQHRILWPAENGSLLGPCPSPGEAEYSATFYAANEALADLGHPLQGPEPEVASPELGRSL
jgi:hypothetical protein